MSEDRQRNGEKFLGRWSRLKQEARTQPPAPPAEKRSESTSAPQLPTLESLSFDSDFSPFMHPEVDDGLRRTALKKLFSDPHFNRIDGLDVYIDDYTGADPIPPDLLQSLMKNHRRRLVSDDETGDDETPAVAEDREAAYAADLPASAESNVDNAPHETVPSPAGATPLPATQPDPDQNPIGAATSADAKTGDTRSS